ncbi:hypothetical protein B0T24DRAFT_710372 [Lasiosphaeria ovina]|uniref:SnoaL-like domain-containing protein n=1 Tax=Lasiosphaeria ovina TaxID=92902 RepID=A0AAE0N1M4_9PEZI|nr:hypothetical protein B0T24DRAFT_710372 [Lasiosphaeria ovina]
MASTRRQTALAAIDAINAWDISRIMAVRAPNCEQQILPKSLNRPSMNNEAYEKHFERIKNLFRNYHLAVEEIIEDTDTNKIVISAHGSADTPVGPYSIDYMLVLHFTDDGTKITRVSEWVDSAVFSEFSARLVVAMTINATN